jgi:hypothetical protein
MRTRKLVSLAIVAAFAGLISTAALAADQTWTGKISDSMCGAKHHAGAEHDAKMTDADCTKACVKHGAKYVFVSDGKVLAIANQDFAGLEEHAGHTVKLTGEMSGDSIKVSKIEMPPAKPKAGAKKPA